MKTFFPRSAGKWYLVDMEMDKMATMAGRYYNLFRPSRCPDNGVHPNFLPLVMPHEGDLLREIAWGEKVDSELFEVASNNQGDRFKPVNDSFQVGIMMNFLHFITASRCLP